MLNIATKIIAHRGCTDEYPENTLAAFRAALDKDADTIELDVHLTSDGKLVVHHDYYLGNPDNGEGLIFKQSLAYIKSLGIGNESIPTLQEVFEMVGDKMHYEIELKGFTRAFLRLTADLVQRFGLTKHVEFTSPTSYNLTQIKRYSASFRTGMFVQPFPAWMDDELGQAISISNALLGGIDVLHCPIGIISKPFIKQAHRHKLLIHAADCDSEADLQTAFSLGVDQLSTNKLEQALSIRQAYL